MYACLNKAEIDSLRVSLRMIDTLSSLPVVRSSDRLGKDRGNVDVFDLAL